MEQGRAILWHCADGKDRTGCAAMLLLFALGASRETVMEDYLLTNVFNAQKLEVIRQRVAPLGSEPKKLETLLFLSGGVIEGYLTRAIEAMNREFGGVQGYLSEALGIGEIEISELRCRLLTEA